MTALRRMGLPLLAALCLVLALVQAAPVATPASRAARDVAATSLGVYVALRSINAALSVAQEIEVGGSLGVSVNARPLKLLEPVDDTVERVAGVVFGLSLLAGALALSAGPVASLGFLLLGVGLLVRAFEGPLNRGLGSAAAPVCRAGRACNLTGVTLALLLPLSLVVGSHMGAVLTQDAWDEAQADLAEITAYAVSLQGPAEEDLQAGEPGEEPGPIGWLRNLVSSAGEEFSAAAEQAGDYLDAAGYFLDQADRLFTASITILAVFLLRTLILPVAVLAVTLALARQIARP